jgi:trichothecene 3-O-acetyltransferase
MPLTYTRLFLVFKAEDVLDAVQALQGGLEKTCYQVPYLKGTISRQSSNRNALAISWGVNSPLPELKHIKTSDFPSLGRLKAEEAPLEYFGDKLAPVRARPDSNKAQAFATSYTEIDGGLLLCICVHHNLMDGTGVGELIRVWAENTKSSFPSKEKGLDNAEPLHRLYTLTGKHSPEETKGDIPRDQLLKKHPEFTLASLGKGNKLAGRPSGPCTSRIFQLSVSKMHAAKEALRLQHSLSEVTTYHIISALAWSSICRVRSSRLGENAPAFSKLGFAVNGRRHLGKDVTEKMYLGNVNLFGLAMLTKAKLCAAVNAHFKHESLEVESLLPILRAKSAAIARINAAYITEVIALIQQSPDVTDIMPGWNGVEGLDLTMTSWANLPIYELDFGECLGKPLFVRPPYAEWDGLVIVLPRRRRETAGDEASEEVVEVVVMARKDDMERLEKDVMWNTWSTSRGG